jgi:16S rRNA C967 or C1407 C5-methylase (RsmB/RsmF family)/NOL1/NOP2/fmu family ribosome biogenesis protein
MQKIPFFLVFLQSINPKSMKLPSEFAERTLRLMGEENYRAFEAALQREPSVSVRVNHAKWARTPQGRRVPWSAEGIYLDRRPTFTFDPLFHAGCYYVQEAGSMCVEQALRTYVQGPVVMLDLCAAPGGKSTHARSVLPAGSLLVANEVMRNRSQVLAENLIKWGYPEVIVTNNDPADFTPLGPTFDVILTDVPCSGEGMFRKDAVAVEEWSLGNVANCEARQRRILTDIWPTLKPGGLLIYSTCTYNREENEDNVRWISRTLGAEILPLPVDPAWGITGNLTEAHFPVYRFLPHRTQGEGFFMAVLRKQAPDSEAEDDETIAIYNKVKKEKRDRKAAPKAPAIPAEARTWVKESEAYLWQMQGDTAVAFPAAHAPLYQRLKQALRVIHAGITVGSVKGRDFIPDHSLAMSTALRRQAFATAEVTFDQAIAYLRKESLVLQGEVPRGYVLLTYQGAALGFVKHLGNRANNLYPTEWRIRSGYLPESVQPLF